jgi:hypothetical protein
MLVATYSNTPSNEGAFVMTATPRRLKPEELAELVKQVQALRAVTKMTGVFTSRRIGSLLEGLCTEDMVEVGKALQLKPREMPRKAEPTFNR